MKAQKKKQAQKPKRSKKAIKIAKKFLVKKKVKRDKKKAIKKNPKKKIKVIRKIKKINKKQKSRVKNISKKKKVAIKKKAALRLKKKIIKRKKIVIKKKQRSVRKIKKAKVYKVKIIKKQLVESFPAETLFKAKIKVVGIGGGGGSIVSEIGRSLQKATFVIADTDIRALKKRSGIKYFWFGKDLTHGLGTGVNPELAEKAAELEREKISELLKDQDIVILIASLGGGLGSGAAKIFAQEAKSFGGITLGIFTLPFKFEGKNKSKIALKALKELKDCLNVSITIPNERIFKIIDTNTPITQAFSLVNKNLIESLESLIDLIYNPGLINIDFADLRTILRGSGNYAFLNTVEASGKDRAIKIIENIFENPLYQNNNFIAEKILFNISGGANLNMFEVERISKAISDLNPKAKIIFGVSKGQKSKNTVRTTLLMTGPGKTAKVVEEKKEAVVVKPVVEKTGEIVKDKPIPKKKHSKKSKIKKPSKPKKEKELVEAGMVPIFNKESTPVASAKFSVTELPRINIKKNIRRNALEIKKAEDIEKNKQLKQEEEWEIPAFLRRVKFKS